MMRFNGKVAIVTGSTSGIGLGIARGLASEGCAVVLNSHLGGDEEEKIASDLAAETGTEVRFVKADMADAEAIHNLAEAATAALGKVDILVNNAGIQHVCPIAEFPEPTWNAVQGINLNSAFLTIKAVLPGMIDRGWGRVVNIASAHGLVASPFKSAYVPAKHGMVGLSKVVALETAEAGVTCNTVCPGYVWTPLVEKQIDDQAKAHGITTEEVVRDVLLKPQPNKRFVTVEEVSALTAFLCSDEAASITGTAIPIDGGWTAQ